MAIVTKEEILKGFSEIVGDVTDDKAIKLIEDISDTFSDYTEKVGDDWKGKYQANDEEWRKKYKERFFSSNDTTPEDALRAQAENVREDGETRTFDELFKEREG